MNQHCKCGKKIIIDISCGYFCKCGRRWWWNFRKSIYILVDNENN